MTPGFRHYSPLLPTSSQTGANMTATDNKGRQPAHRSATRNHKPILQLLFKCGVDLDSQCAAGKTPLHYAAQFGS